MKNFIGLVVICGVTFFAACSRDTGQHTQALKTTQSALFTNGGFESDAINSAPSSWILETYLNDNVSPLAPGSNNNLGLSVIPPQSITDLNLSAGTGVATIVVVGAGTPESVEDPDLGTGATFRYPKFDTRSAVVNNGITGKNQNVNSIKQQMTISASDVDPVDNKVHIRFVAAPVLQNPNHNDWEQPYFFIQLTNVTRNTLLYKNFNFANQPGVPWKSVGNIQYTDWQLVDIVPDTAVSMGDQVELIVIAAGCSRGGHWGRVYVDAFGPVIPGLFVSGTGPSSAFANTDITYTLHYQNGGATATDNTELHFFTPPHTTFRSMTGSGCTTPAIDSTGEIVCNIGTVAPGAGGTYTVTVHIHSAYSGLVTAGNYWTEATGISPLLGTRVDTVVTGVPASIDVVSGTPQSATIGNAFAAPLVAVVKDANGIVVPNVAVDFLAPGMGAASAVLSSASATTDFNGQASITATANTTAGNYDVTASVSGVAMDATYSLTNNVGAPASIVVSSGSGQSATVLTAFAQHLRALVKDSGGNPVPGITVHFNPPGAGVSATMAATAVTNSSGLAEVLATANSIAGGPYAVTASVFGVLPAANFSLTNTPSAAASISVVSGSSQSTPISTAFAQPLVALVKDAHNNPVSGVTVTFTSTGLGAAATFSGSMVTDAAGRVSITATANSISGSYSVDAKVPGVLSAATFALTNTPSAPTSIQIVGGNAQSAVVATTYANPLVIKVVDVGGNGVANVPVTFNLPLTGPNVSLSSLTFITDSSGQASVSAVANTIAGICHLFASIGGAVPHANFVLTNLPGPATLLNVVSGGIQTTQVNTAFSASLLVVARDAFGNVVPNVHITWSVPSIGASATLSASDVVTDSNGQASIEASANATAGSYSVIAKLPGGQQANFVLTNSPLPAISIFAESGTPQHTIVGTGFTNALVVRVQSGGVLVPNALVTFQVPSQGSSAVLNAVTVPTDMTGHAQVLAAAGHVAGSYAVTASVAGSAQPASFALTNDPGMATTAVVSTASSPQTAHVGTAFPVPLLLTVFDAFGNVVPGVSVTFAAPSSSPTAALSSVTALTTDTNGQASVLATADTGIGTYVVTATIAGILTPVSFTLSNSAGFPLGVSVVSGSPQSTEVNTAFGAPLVVQVTDATGSSVSGVTVTFDAPNTGAGAVFSSTTAVTDSSGNAHITATAKKIAGQYEVTATVPSGSGPARFVLTNAAGAPTAVSARVNATPQSARVTTAYALPLEVVVTDTFGNHVPGVTVAFDAPSMEPTATFTQSSPATDSNGMASVTAVASDHAGSFVVTATVAGVSDPAEFDLTNLAGEPLSVSAVSGSGQSTLATTQFHDPLIVQVVDRFGNPVPGAHVVVTVPSIGPSATVGGMKITGDDGRCSLLLTANDHLGIFDLSVSVAESSAPVAIPFTVTAIPTQTTIAGITGGTSNQPLTVTARVVSTPGTPNGDVQFLLDGDTLGTGTLTNGFANIALAVPREGTHKVKVVYAAQGIFGASESAAVDLIVDRDGATLNGGGGCTTTPGERGSNLWMVSILALGWWLQRRFKISAIRRSSLCAVIALAAPSLAVAQAAGATGANINVFHPAPAGTDWFSLDSMDYRERLLPTVRLLVDYSQNPLVVYNADGSVRSRVVTSQWWLNVGASYVISERVRWSFDLPVSIEQQANQTIYQGARIDPQSGSGVGDLSMGLDARILGVYGDPFTLGAGFTIGVPTGSQTDLLGNGTASVAPHLSAAGQWGIFEYAAQASYAFRSGRIADVKFNNEVRLAASAGAWLFSHELLVGPELYGAVDVGPSAGQMRPAGFEGDLGAHYQLSSQWLAGFGVGTGLARSPGIPELRVLASIQWVGDAQEKIIPPPDRDGDGFPDAVDPCPDEFGPVPLNGCPAVKDRDRDGILDDKDLCPDVAQGDHPNPEKMGCPDLDRDGDGFLDHADQCPDLAIGAHPDPTRPGCPMIDRDGDKVLDEVDACPDQPGAPNPDPKKNGCPGLVEIKNSQIVILTPVLFATDKDVILSTSSPVLEAVANTMKAMPQIKRVAIDGHTDSQGKADHNLILSEKRAKSVMTWLVAHGIAADRLESHGFGQTQPIDDNATLNGRAANRRVEFRILEQ